MLLFLIICLVIFIRFSTAVPHIVFIEDEPAFMST